VLVAVGLQVAGGQGGIGLHVVAEFDDLDLQAVFLGDLLDVLHDLGVGAGGDAHLDGVLGVHAEGTGSCNRQCSLDK